MVLKNKVIVKSDSEVLSIIRKEEKLFLPGSPILRSFQ